MATRAAAGRISTLAGTRHRYTGWNTKTTLFKGIFKKSSVENKGDRLYVDK